MDSKKIVFQETLIVAAGQVVCIGAMIGVFALLGFLDKSVIFGGVVGGVLAILNFFFMAVSASMAMDKAANQDVEGGKKLIRTSQILRYAVLFILLFAFIKSDICNMIAIVLPVVFVRPILLVGEFFRKSGDSAK